MTIKDLSTHFEYITTRMGKCSIIEYNSKFQFENLGYCLQTQPNKVVCDDIKKTIVTDYLSCKLDIKNANNERIVPFKLLACQGQIYKLPNESYTLLKGFRRKKASLPDPLCSC